MAKQKWIWDIYSSPTIEAARFENPGIVAQFPMNVIQTRFGDLAQEKQLQICDILAGACSSILRFDRSGQRDLDYRARLLEAGVEKLILGGLWPSTDMNSGKSWPKRVGREHRHRMDGGANASQRAAVYVMS